VASSAPAAHAVPSKQAAQWPLVGRLEELALIKDVLAGPDGRGLVLAGAAGIGKTRLALEALDESRSRGFATQLITASRAAASIPFGCLAHLLPVPARLGQSRLELLRQAVHALFEQAGTRQLVVGVDDAHLLDDASATFVSM